MVNNLKFSSKVLLFNEEDKGFGKNKPPVGYLKLEIREGKGKLSSMVQDLKDSDEYTVYKLYFIKYREGEVFYACMGTIPVKNGRGQIIRRFDAFNVEDTKFSIDDYDAAAIVLEREIGGRFDIRCPLAVYELKDEKVRWDQVFSKFTTKVKMRFREESSMPGHKEECLGIEISAEGKNRIGDYASKKITGSIISKEFEKAESIGTDGEIKGTGEENIAGELNAIGTGTSVINEVSTGDKINTTDEINKAIEMGFSKDLGQNGDIRKDEDEIKKDEAKDEVYGNANGSVHRNAKDDFEEKFRLMNGGVIEEKEHGMGEHDIQKDNMEQHTQPDYDKYDDIYSKYTGGLESKYSFAENMRGVYTGVNCQRCTSKIPDIDLLSNCLDKAFKRCDPFNTKRKDYKWWKATSPIHLSNILYYCNIHVPKIFSPPVIMAYYKYRYLITGIYTSRKRNKVYIVHGIPGTYNVDESPLGDLCRWVQTEGNTPRYGSFGYWVAYVDPFTGEFLKLNQ